MSVYLSPFEHLVRIESNIFAVRHALGEVYLYDVVDAVPTLLFDLNSIPGSIIDLTINRNIAQGFAIKNSDVFSCKTTGEIYKNAIQIGSCDLPEIFSVFGSIAGDSIYIHGSDSGLNSYKFQEFDVATGLIVRTITWPDWLGSFVPAKKSDNVLVANWYSTEYPSGVLRLWNVNTNTELTTFELGPPDGITSDYYSGTKDMNVIVSFLSGSWRFHCINELGVEIGVLVPPVTDIQPGNDFTNYGMSCTATSDTHISIFTVNSGATFYNTYEIDVTRDNTGMPINVVLGAHVLTKNTLVLNELGLSNGWMHGQAN